MKNIENILICYLTIILLDTYLIIKLRKLVYSFLLSKRNSNGAKRIHKSQSLWNRVTLFYIRELAIYREYDFFQKVRLSNIIFTIIQYIVIIFFSFLEMQKAIYAILLFLVIKFIFGIWIHTKFDAYRFAKFDKRYKK